MKLPSVICSLKGSSQQSVLDIILGCVLSVSYPVGVAAGVRASVAQYDTLLNGVLAFGSFVDAINRGLRDAIIVTETVRHVLAHILYGRIVFSFAHCSWPLNGAGRTLPEMVLSSFTKADGLPNWKVFLMLSNFCLTWASSLPVTRMTPCSSSG